MRKSLSVVVPSLLLLCVLNPKAGFSQVAGPMQKGYIHVQSEGGTSSPTGIALFGVKSDGILVSEAGVSPATPMRSGRMFAEIQAGVKTGIALSNPTNQDASISYSFTDGSGQDFGDGSFTLAAHHQMESFFDEDRFALPSSLVGTFSFTSCNPVTAIGLRTTVNQRGEVLKTTLPVSDLNHGFGGTELPIPQLGNAESWTIQIVLVNPGDALLVGTMQFFGPVSGTLSMHPTKVIVDNVSDSIVHYAIPPHGAFQIRPRPAQSSVRPGS